MPALPIPSSGGTSPCFGSISPCTQSPLLVLACVTFAPALSKPADFTLNLRSRAALPGKEPVAAHGTQGRVEPEEDRDHRLRHVGPPLVQVRRGPRRRTGRPDERDAQGRPRQRASSSSMPRAPARTSTRTRRSASGRRTAPFAKTPVAAGHDRTLGHGLELARREARGRAADRRLRHGLRLQGEVRDPLAVDAADRGHRDRRGRRHHRRRTGDVEPADPSARSTT